MSYVPKELWGMRIVRELDIIGRYFLVRLLGTADQWGRIPVDMVTICRLAYEADVDSPAALESLESLFSPESPESPGQPLLIRYSRGNWAQIVGFDTLRPRYLLRNRALPSGPEPPLSVWKAAGCLRVCSKNRRGDNLPGLPGWENPESPESPESPVPRARQGSSPKTNIRALQRRALSERAREATSVPTLEPDDAFMASWGMRSPHRDEVFLGRVECAALKRWCSHAERQCTGAYSAQELYDSHTYMAAEMVQRSSPEHFARAVDEHIAKKMGWGRDYERAWKTLEGFVRTIVAQDKAKPSGRPKVKGEQFSTTDMEGLEPAEPVTSVEP